MTVQPVIDLAEHLHVGSYEASARLKLQTQLRDVICAFPYCFRPAERCDCDHRVPHDPDRDDGGPTCSCNLAPACRGHHRAKTTGDDSQMASLDFAYRREQLYLEILLDIRDAAEKR